MVLGLHLQEGPVQAPGSLHPDKDNFLIVHDLEIARALPVLPEKIHGPPQVCEGQGPLDRLLRYRPSCHTALLFVPVCAFARRLWNSRFTGRVRILTV